MNFLKKYAVLIAILLYIIIGIGWVIYIYSSDSQANFQWTWNGLLIDAILVVMWPIYPFNGLFSGEKSLMIVGEVGLVVVLIIITVFSLLLRKANRKKPAKSD